MTKKVVYGKTIRAGELLLEEETQWDDGSREVKRFATTSKGYEGYGENDELRLFITEDPAEEIADYGVTWNGLCGYFSASIHTASEEDAKKLFEALQKVTGYSVS